MLSFVLLAFISVIILTLMCKYQMIEKFTSSVYLIQDKQKQNIFKTTDLYDKNLDEFVRNMTPKFSFVGHSTSELDLIYDDILSYDMNKTIKSNIVVCTNSKNISCFIKDVSTIDDGHISLLVNEKIGYMRDIDVILMKSIFFCYNIKLRDENLIKMASHEEAIKELSSIKSIKSVFLYSNHENPHFQYMFKNTEISLYTFDDINAEKVRFILPHATLRNHNFKLSFPKYIDRFSVKKTLSFDNIIYINSDKWNYLIDYIILYFQHNYDYINYYERFYKIYTRTKLLYKNKEAIILSKKHKNILEQFSQTNTIELRVSHNIKGFYDASIHSFIYNGDTINGTPIEESDLVCLTGQTNTTENGEYIVKSIKRTNKKTIAVLQLKSIPQPLDPREDARDPRYVCFTDRNIKIKNLCESKFDTKGNPKRSFKEDVWDRPCDVDTECPFYQINRNYKNYRGGCNNGYCEMPLGVNRTAFRKYEGKPFCYGCSDKYDPACCEKQSNPDYVFVMDDYERNAGELIEEFSTDDGIKSNFSTVESENVYHFEVSNEEMMNLLKPLIGLSIKPDFEPIDFVSILSSLLNDLIKMDTPIGIYNLSVDEKDITDKLAKYTISFVTHREGKSHGKNINAVITQNIDNGMITIDTMSITGIVMEQNIDTEGTEFSGVTEILYNKDFSNFSDTHFRSISEDSIFEKEKTKNFICDRALKLKQEFNLSVNCDI